MIWRKDGWGWGPINISQIRLQFPVHNRGTNEWVDKECLPSFLHTTVTFLSSLYLLFPAPLPTHTFSLHFSKPFFSRFGSWDSRERAICQFRPAAQSMNHNRGCHVVGYKPRSTNYVITYIHNIHALIFYQQFISCLPKRAGFQGQVNNAFRSIVNCELESFVVSTLEILKNEVKQSPHLTVTYTKISSPFLPTISLVKKS